MKDISDKPTVHTILNGEIIKAFPLKEQVKNKQTNTLATCIQHSIGSPRQDN